MYYKLYVENLEQPYFCIVEITKKGEVAFSGSEDGNYKMAIVQNPVMGQMTGSYANINTYTRNGQNVVSAKAFNRKDSNTAAQQLQRASFKLIADAYAALAGYGDMGFPQRNARQSAYNVFMAVNLPNAIDSSGDVPIVDYSKLTIAKGTLPEVIVVQATISAAGVRLQCETNIDYPKALADDVVIALVKKVGRAAKAVQVARGNAEQLQIDVAMPGITAAEIEFVYVFANSADGKKASKSAYVPVV